MSKFKHAALALAAAGLMTVQAQASEPPSTQVQAQSAEAFSDAEIAALFEPSGPSMQLAALSGQEMKETEGAWLNFAFGGAAGLGFYGWHHRNNFSNMTWRGAVFSAGTGALTGGIGGSLIRASGGGWAGNIAWRPNIVASNFGFSQFRNSRGW